MDIEFFVSTLKDGIATSLHCQEDFDEINWRDNVGVLISANQAQFVLDLIQENEALKFQIQQYNVGMDEYKFKRSFDFPSCSLESNNDQMKFTDQG